ncbi:hypothetical protein [Cupriavidus campinensis]
MGWFLVTIILPLFAPVAMLLCFRVVPMSAEPPRVSPLTLVKDGQLCWGAIGFCASGLYELLAQLMNGVPLDPTLSGFLTFWLVAMLVASSLFAVFGAAYPTALECPPGHAWYHHYRLFALSALVVILAGGAYATVHFDLLTLTGTEESP